MSDIQKSISKADIASVGTDNERDSEDVAEKSKFTKLIEFLWDGEKTAEEKAYLRRLDFFLLIWGCYGYFIRILDSSNFTNAYVSGMKEAVGINGDDYNYIISLWQAGYVVGVIPSQILILKVRPSLWFPIIEILWAVITFCTSKVTTVQQLYGLRFILGLLESPFYVGALSIFSSWYSSRELAKRAAILYSASNISSMFSGYLQSAVYTHLNGQHGYAGWQWLFIICGSMTLALSFFGFIAIPDYPYKTNKLSNFWLKDEYKALALKRYQKERVQFTGYKFSEVRTMLLDWPFYAIVFTYSSYMIFTNAQSYFTLYIDSLGRFSVSQVNNIPTSSSGVALIGNLLLGWLADYKSRYLVLQIALVFNLVSSVFLLITPSEGCIWFGYMISGVSWIYGPIFLTWSQEFLRRSEFEGKFTIGIAQASATANLIWATIVLWSTAKQYPYYKAAYIVCLVLTVIQFPITYFINRAVYAQNRLNDVSEINEKIQLEEAEKAIKK